MWSVFPQLGLLLFAIAGLGWLYSFYRHNVNIVDSLWSLFFLSGSLFIVYINGQFSIEYLLLLVPIAIWALRLSFFLLLRNHNKAEDRRYHEMRLRRGNSFRFKSLYIIFGLQAAIALLLISGWLPALSQGIKPGPVVLAGILIWLIGFIFESVADYQLYQFKRDAVNRGKIMTRGLWALSRHPNYFGETLVWWGLYLMMLEVSPWWIIISPVLMTLLIIKVSGISLMEKGMDNRRPGYQQYADNTPAFIPGVKFSSKTRATL